VAQRHLHEIQHAVASILQDEGSASLKDASVRGARSLESAKQTGPAV
jgi:hypothetical protein